MSYVESALADANVEGRDGRGLMPIARARQVLDAATAVTRESLDEIWAAMLSLTTPEELVTATKHLDWQHPVRGMENLALVERYGDGALGWLSSRVKDGVLINHPWCVVPSLLAIEQPEVLDLLLPLRGAVIDGGSMQFWQYTGPDTAVDPATLERNALALVLEWARRHPEVAEAALAARADHPRAAEARRLIAERNELSVERILATLDGACRGETGTWPWFNMGVDGRCEYFGLRLVAVRSASGNGWSIVLERLMGCDPDSFQIARYAYGPFASNDSNSDHLHDLSTAFELLQPEDGDEEDDDDGEDDEDDDDDDDDDDEDDDDDGDEEDHDDDEVSVDDAEDDEADEEDDDEEEAEEEDEEEDDDERPVFGGMIARGPAGDLTLDESLFATFDLKPGWVTEAGGWMARTLAIRAYLAEHPGVFWPDPAEALEATGLPDGEVLLASTAFEHASGRRHDDGPVQKWHVLPSESATYRSLAEAVVARDASKFIPGESNLDWRLHATEKEDGYEPPWHAHRVDTSAGYLAAAMAEAEVACDDRGLMPLAEARAIAGSTTVLARGAGRRVGATWVWDLDRTWAALLSLADAAEAATWFKKLAFEDLPRDAANNRALVERYGDGALQLVARRAGTGGVIEGNALLRATVLGVGTPGGFSFVHTIAGWNEAADEGEAAPPADVQLRGLFDAWIAAHPEVGYVELARRAQKGDERASAYLKEHAAPKVRRVYRWLVPALGEEGARAALAAVGLSCELAAGQILAALDEAAADPASWPVFVTGQGPSLRELHALRLVGARARGSEDWAIVVERFEGYTIHNCSVQRYVYGEHGVNGLREDLRVPIAPGELPDLPVDEADAKIVEAPDYWTKHDNAPAAIARIRAVLRAEPARFFAPAPALLAQVGIADPAVVIESLAFEQTAGDPPPSAAGAYSSLAEALVAIDAGQFIPGKPNNTYASWARSLEEHEAAQDDEDAD